MEAGLWNAEKHLSPVVGFLLAGERIHNSPLIYIPNSCRKVFKHSWNYCRSKPAGSDPSVDIDLDVERSYG